jgi:hypothetical protein
VQEFVGDPIDGVTLLLELLKTIQQNGTQTKCTPANQRRNALDENSCLQCLKYCLRCQDAARRLAVSSAGLYTLAACIMSTVNSSRLLTLEVCTRIFTPAFPVGTIYFFANNIRYSQFLYTT